LIPTASKIACSQILIPFFADNSGAQNLNLWNNSFIPAFCFRMKDVIIPEMEAVAGQASRMKAN